MPWFLDLPMRGNLSKGCFLARDEGKERKRKEKEGKEMRENQGEGRINNFSWNNLL